MCYASLAVAARSDLDPLKSSQLAYSDISIMMTDTQSMLMADLDAPYEEGATIGFSIDGAHDTVQAKIIHCHKPYTLSCVLSVEVPGYLVGSQAATARAALKVFDRRLAHQLRKGEVGGSWTSQREDDLARFVATGEAAKFLARLQDDDDDFEEPEEGWTDAEDEVYLHSRCLEFYQTEKKAYEVLHFLQGSDVPQLFGSVTIRDKQTLSTSRMKTVGRKMYFPLKVSCWSTSLDRYSGSFTRARFLENHGSPLSLMLFKSRASTPNCC